MYRYSFAHEYINLTNDKERKKKNKLFYTHYTCYIYFEHYWNIYIVMSVPVFEFLNCY